MEPKKPQITVPWRALFALKPVFRGKKMKCTECGAPRNESPRLFRPIWSDLAYGKCLQDIIVSDRHRNFDGSLHQCSETGVTRCKQCGAKR